MPGKTGGVLGTGTSMSTMPACLVGELGGVKLVTVAAGLIRFELPGSVRSMSMATAWEPASPT